MRDNKRVDAAIILAAGQGKRMHSEVPKQFLPLGGRPLLWHSLKAFDESGTDVIVLVTDKNSFGYCEDTFLNSGEFKKTIFITAGGSERYESVYSGLKKISEKSGLSCRNVLIHDGARPFLTSKMIDNMLTELQTKKACIYGMPVKDTIKEADQNGFVKNTPERKSLWQIQTPQGFSYPEILSSYEQVLKSRNKDGITDDSMVWELSEKEPVFIMEGSYRNIKITTPEDLLVGKAFLENAE